MPLSWENVIDGSWQAEAAAITFFSIGPIQGPSVITNVILHANARGFTIKRFAYSVSFSSEASQANFNQGTKLLHAPVKSSGGVVRPELHIISNGSTGEMVDIPVWYTVTTKPVFMIVSMIKETGSAVMDCHLVVKATHLWPEESKRSPLR